MDNQPNPDRASEGEKENDSTENGPVVDELEESSQSNEDFHTQYLTDTDDDPADFSYRNDSPLELLEKKDLQNSDRIPLVPTDFTSISEAIQNFTAVFESRYGAQHPPFYEGPLQKAIADAFDNPIVEERRPLAIYLHHDDAVAAHIFPQTVICSMEVSSLLKCQFVVWAWDMTQNQNRQSFYEWMSLSNLSITADMIRMIAHSKFPLLIVLAKDRGQIQHTTLIYGQENCNAAIQKLMLGLDNYQMIREQEKQEERNRLERELFRKEQAEEYQRSLEADRAKQQELNKLKELEREEEENKRREEDIKKEYLRKLAKKLPSEPKEDDSEAITIRIRCPNGELKERRFRRGESIDTLIIYSETIGFDLTQYRLWTSDRPRKEIGAMDRMKTFMELGWPKREQITIEEK